MIETNPNNTLIVIEHLNKVYPNVTPLKDVNAVINRGEIISLIGPSGTGKSTLLRCLNLLEKPTSGKITINGTEITAKKCDIATVRQKMGMVFQSFNLFENKNVIENLMLAPITLLKKPPQTAFTECMALLKMVGLSEKAFNYPDELSGGQKQRVAIARCLAMNPEIILFDEPTSALDPTMVGEVLAVIRNLARQGLTMIIVTHEMKFARDVSTRVFYMDEGVIYEDGTPEQVFECPEKEKTRIFVKRLRIFSRTIESSNFDFIGINNDMEEYAHRNGFTAKQTNAALLLFEELAVQLIIPHMSKNFKLELGVEFSEQDNNITMSLNYDGEEFNPILNADEISQSLVKKLSKNLFFAYENGLNSIILTI